MTTKQAKTTDAAAQNRGFVKKRDGTIVQWDKKRIERAMLGAFLEVDPDRVPNLSKLADEVSKIVFGWAFDGGWPVEQIQDAVEEVLMRDHQDAARAFIKYRAKRTELRDQRMAPDPEAISGYIHAAKYAKWLPNKLRRETYEETVNRSMQMHIDRFVDEGEGDRSTLLNKIKWAFGLVKAKRVLPSMRSMQFAGDPIERNNARMYNCAFTHMNRKRAFGETMHVLLSGCGMGYSVQMHHVEMLPEIKRVDERVVAHFSVPDSIEGWADAVNALVYAYMVHGHHVEFDYSKIRPEGAPISSGGKAPGHLPLKRALENVRGLLHNAQGRKLRPIEVHDAVCFIAEAVLAGGVRRSSLIALFSVEDTEMMHAKAHGNYRPQMSAGDPGVNPQRAMANNSAIMLRRSTTRQQFDRVMNLSKEWGEPGFYFTDDLDYGCNPCGEIGMMPKLKLTDASAGEGDATDKFVYDYDYETYSGHDWKMNEDRVSAYGSSTGVQFCNLTEVNVAKCGDAKQFVEACKAAAFIGTLQAAYTDFGYLGPVTEAVVRGEALLGVGLTGIADNPGIGTDPATLAMGAAAAIEENEATVKIIGINPAARVTTVKPSGTSSLELGCVGSGVHSHHARRYFRRVTAKWNEPPFKAFAKVNPHMIEWKPNGDACIVFPVQAPDGSITVKDLDAPAFIAKVATIYEHWVVPGSSTPHNRLRLTHNVSATVVVRDDEWKAAIDAAWSLRRDLTALSFMPSSGDKKYPFAPREEVSTPADEAKWNAIVSGYAPIAWSMVIEGEDGTSFVQEPACQGGACEV